MKKINLKNKFKKFSEHWSPKVIAELNDYQFKLVKIKDDFVWHNHEHTDEAFIVIKGLIKSNKIPMPKSTNASVIKRIKTITFI